MMKRKYPLILLLLLFEIQFLSSQQRFNILTSKNTQQKKSSTSSSSSTGGLNKLWTRARKNHQTSYEREWEDLLSGKQTKNVIVIISIFYVSIYFLIPLSIFNLVLKNYHPLNLIYPNFII